MKPKTSCGFDGIPMKLLKSIKNIYIYILAEPLTIVINHMINTCILPDLVKIAKVIPIHKKDDETVFNNYRPISLLPAISKIFEKIVFLKTYNFFQRENIYTIVNMVLEINAQQNLKQRKL